MDGISNKALKLMGDASKDKLLYIVNAVIRLQYFSRCWKLAVIVSIPKWDKDPTPLVNIRPISLLNTFARIVESFMKDQLQDFVEEKLNLDSANTFQRFNKQPT